MTNREKAKEKFGEYHEEIQSQHNAAWARCEKHVLSLVLKGAKVFEVHHTLNYARELYFVEFNKGLPADLCERAVMRAYTVTP